MSLNGDAYFQDPFGFFARLRASRPVASLPTPGYGQAWFVTRYADVREVLTDPGLAKDVRRWPGGERSRPSEATGVSKHMLHVDPPEHTRLRRLVQKELAPYRTSLRPCAERVAERLLDALDAGGETVDLLDAFARPLPIAVLSALLGVPETDRAWVADTVAAYDQITDHERVELELADFLVRLIAVKRTTPGDDLLSVLVAASDSAEDPAVGMTDGELVSTAYLLVMAGFDTTVNLIASGVLALLDHPEELAKLTTDPSMLPGAVEELLRFTSPVNHANDRFTTEDTVVGDVVIPAGQWVLPALSSANRDGAKFPDPDRLDLTRDASGHLGFGHGVHYCLGAPLARMEAEVAIGALLKRFPHVSLAVPPDQIRWRSLSLINGLESLPVHLKRGTYTAGQAGGSEAASSPQPGCR